MTPIVYILGKGSKWEDNELRYSLRSVELYGRNVDEVVIVGECPTWLQKVRHIPADDRYAAKADNTWHKLQTACKILANSFVLMNDDFYLLQGVDMDALPLYCNGTIDALLQRYTRNSKYTQAQANSLAVLRNNGLPTGNYALHCPMKIVAAMAMDLFSKYGNSPGLSFRNMYGNSYKHEVVTELQDLKLDKETIVNQYQLLQMFGDFPWFSIGDRFLDANGQKILQQLYPNKSKYEQ